ncbi:MAG: PilZ domain-containing protein [Myxococcaceae bacterium]
MDELGSHDDRRKSERHPMHLWVEEQDGNDVHYRQAANLSVGGLYLQKTFAYDVGTKLNIRFSLPHDSHVIRARAEVVRYKWQEGDGPEMGMALRFIDLAPEDRARIAAYLQER